MQNVTLPDRIVLPTSDADTLIMVQAWFWMLRKMESAEVAK